MSEQMKSESIRGPINKKNRQRISESIAIRIDSENINDANNQKLAERNNRVGMGYVTAERISNGSSDRLNAIVFDSNKYFDRKEQEAYTEGFFEHGNRELSANCDSLSPELLKAIGYNDYLSGVDISSLPDRIRKNDFYGEGYLLATIKENKSKKSR